MTQNRKGSKDFWLKCLKQLTFLYGPRNFCPSVPYAWLRHTSKFHHHASSERKILGICTCCAWLFYSTLLIKSGIRILWGSGFQSAGVQIPQEKISGLRIPFHGARLQRSVHRLKADHWAVKRSQISLKQKSISHFLHQDCHRLPLQVLRILRYYRHPDNTENAVKTTSVCRNLWRILPNKALGIIDTL